MTVRSRLFKLQYALFVSVGPKSISENKASRFTVACENVVLRAHLATLKLWNVNIGLTGMPFYALLCREGAEGPGVKEMPENKFFHNFSRGHTNGFAISYGRNAPTGPPKPGVL